MRIFVVFSVSPANCRYRILNYTTAASLSSDHWKLNHLSYWQPRYTNKFIERLTLLFLGLNGRRISLYRVTKCYSISSGFSQNNFWRNITKLILRNKLIFFWRLTKELTPLFQPSSSSYS
jgi:hypothetical protein